MLSIDKCTEGEESVKIYQKGDDLFRATVRLSTEGTKIISITQTNLADAHNSIDENKDQLDHESRKSREGLNLEFSFKGFGISLIDNKP